jgi:hypothetical protein
MMVLYITLGALIAWMLIGVAYVITGYIITRQRRK